MNKKIVYGGILIAILLAIGGYFFPKGTVQTIIQEAPKKLGQILDTFTFDNVVVNATSTLNTLNAGNYYYDKIGKSASEQLYAYGTFSLTATSSVPVVISYPFATTTAGGRALITRISCEGTGLTGSNLVALSTTTLTNSVHGVNASSTRALTGLMTIASGEAFHLVWTPQSVATTTDPDSRLLFNRLDYSQTTTTPFVLFPNEVITLKYASSSPGTFATYASGTCYPVFEKI